MVGKFPRLSRLTNFSHAEWSELIEINKDDYPLSEGCLWYNPSYKNLMSIMFEVLNDYDKAELKAIKAKNYIKANHSINNYKKNLNNIIF